LSAALESTGDSTKAVKAYRVVSHERLERKFEDVKRIAQFRSGARGWNARKIEIDTEAEFAASAERLEADLDQIDAATLSIETKAAVDMLSEAQMALEMVLTLNSRPKNDR